MHEFSWAAVFVAAFSSFMLGGLWYSPILFGAMWVKEVDFKEEQARHPAKVFGFSFLYCVIAAVCYGMLVGRSPELIVAIHYALIAGVGIAATSLGTNYQFSNKSFKLLFIDGGYHITQFLIYAFVFVYLDKLFH